VLGSDGNAYLLRATSPALIYVISANGEVVRKLRIDSPGPGLLPRHMKAAPGRLAISFLEGQYSNLDVVTIIDLNGHVIANYVGESKGAYAGLSGCYVPPSFTFISKDDRGTLRITRAEPK